MCSCHFYLGVLVTSHWYSCSDKIYYRIGGTTKIIQKLGRVCNYASYTRLQCFILSTPKDKRRCYSLADMLCVHIHVCIHACMPVCSYWIHSDLMCTFTAEFSLLSLGAHQNWDALLPTTSKHFTKNCKPYKIEVHIRFNKALNLSTYGSFFFFFFCLTISWSLIKVCCSTVQFILNLNSITASKWTYTSF